MKFYFTVFIVFLFCANTAFSQLDTNKIIPPDPPITDTVAYLVNIAWLNNPMPQTYRSKKVQAEEELHQSKWSWLDAINFAYLFDPSVTSTTTNSQDKSQRFGVGLTVNLGMLFRVPSVIRQSEEEVKIADANLMTHRLYIRTQVIQRYWQFKQNVSMLRIRTDAMNDVQSSLVLVRYRYENGEVTLEQYNSALTAYTDSQEKQIVSLSEMYSSKAALEEILGKQWEEIFK